MFLINPFQPSDFPQISFSDFQNNISFGSGSVSFTMQISTLAIFSTILVLASAKPLKARQFSVNASPVAEDVFANPTPVEDVSSDPSPDASPISGDIGIDPSPVSGDIGLDPSANPTPVGDVSDPFQSPIDPSMDPFQSPTNEDPFATMTDIAGPTPTGDSGNPYFSALWDTTVTNVNDIWGTSIDTNGNTKVSITYIPGASQKTASGAANSAMPTSVQFSARTMVTSASQSGSRTGAAATVSATGAPANSRNAAPTAIAAPGAIIGAIAFAAAMF